MFCVSIVKPKIALKLTTRHGKRGIGSRVRRPRRVSVGDSFGTELVSFSGDGEVCVETLHSLRHIGTPERWVKRCVRQRQWGVLGRQEPGIQWLLWNRRGVCPPKVRAHRRVAPSLLLRN